MLAGSLRLLRHPCNTVTPDIYFSIYGEVDNGRLLSAAELGEAGFDTNAWEGRNAQACENAW